MTEQSHMTGNEKPIIVLTGPTAVGKTGLSLRLAGAVGGSVISADSMQVYKELDIGSAKIRSDEMDGIPHYLIDVLEPEECFDVVRFQQMAREAMKEIWEAGRIPLLTGGTGFYIQAVVRDIDFSESGGVSSLRSKWEEFADAEGDESLHARLAEVDPEAAAEIHPHNRRRVIRALEFYEQTGETISSHNRKQRERSTPYRLAYFVLTDDRKKLYAQIDRRVDSMMKQGLEAEVRKLQERGLTESHTSMKGIGYKEFFPYFRGEYTLERAVELIKQNSRHYAKRQLTWFRREQDVIWIDKASFDYDDKRILDHMLTELKKRNILPA